MVVRDLLIGLGFALNEANVAKAQSAVNSIKNAGTAAAVSAEKAGAGVAAAAGAAATASAGFGTRLAASVGASRAALGQLQGHLTTLKSQLVGLAGVALGGFGLFALADSAVQAGDNLYKLSTRLRMSSGEAAALSRILNATGVDATTFASVITRLDRGLDTAGKKGNATSKALAEFGVSLRDTATGGLLPMNKQLEQLAQGYARAEQAGKGDEFVTDILGPKGLAIVPALRDYADAAEAAKRVKTTGLIDPKQAHEASVEMRVMKMQASQLSLAFAASLGPVINDVARGMAKFLSAMARVVAQYKPLVMVIGRVVTAFMGLFAVVKVGQAIYEMFKTISMGINFLMAANPVLWAIIAAVAVLALVLDDLYAWINGGDSVLGDWLGSWDEFKQKSMTYLQPLLDGMSRLWAAIQQNVIPVLGLLGSAAVATFNAFMAVIGPVISWIISQFAELTNNGQVFFDILLAAWNGLVNGIILALTFWRQIFEGDFSGAIDTVIGFFENLLDTALTILAQIGAAIGKYVLSKLGWAGKMLGNLMGIDLGSTYLDAASIATSGDYRNYSFTQHNTYEQNIAGARLEPSMLRDATQSANDDSYGKFARGLNYAM